MFKRVQNYMQAKPLQAWLISVMLLLTVNLSLLWVMSGPKKPGLILMFVGFALGSPTWNLLYRLSDERRREHPVAPEQESQIGMLSLCATFCSIGSLGILILDKRLGLFVSESVGMGLLLLFSLSEILALVLGYAARYSKWGRWGLTLATLWLLLTLTIASVKLLFL